MWKLGIWQEWVPKNWNGDFEWILMTLNILKKEQGHPRVAEMTGCTQAPGTSWGVAEVGSRVGVVIRMIWFADFFDSG